MKRSLFLLLSFLPFLSLAQVKCYQFVKTYSENEWRDSMMVACTSDPVVIASVEAQLALPLAERGKHINGKIAAGNAGINRNSTHWFLWHFKMNEWTLADFSVEVCDGRPYSDVDMDTAYWLHTIGFFCPWGSYAAREIPVTSVKDRTLADIQLATYPNPASNMLNLVSNTAYNGDILIRSINGQTEYRKQLTVEKNGLAGIDISTLPSGLYILYIPFNEYPQHLRFTKL